MALTGSLSPTARPGTAPRRRSAGSRRRVAAWVAAAAAVLGAAVAVVLATGMRPDYDAFGWLVWGRQVLHWNLNTDGAPSWKPLTFIFTLPYALAGQTQMLLWMVTAVAAALGGCVFAARIAHRLCGPQPRRRWAAPLAGAFAAAGVLGLATYSRLILIANSDPMVVTLLLAAIDAHLCARRRLAFWLLLLASLGRPESWPFAAGYALWLWLVDRRTAPVSLAGLLLIPAAWFVIPALTSRSWFIAGDLALHQKTVIHGSKLAGVILRLRSLDGLPMQLAALGSIAIALWRRDRATLTLAGCAALWVAIEVGFALHGWSAVNRYLIEPAAVLVVVAAVGVGRALSAQRPAALAYAGPLAVAALVAALVPSARERARQARIDYDNARAHAVQVRRLQAVVRRIGGPGAIRACGQPTTLLGFQSALAWVVGINVGNVGFRPGRAIARGEPIVLLKPHDLGWQVRVYNMPRSRAARCDRLRTDSAMG
ncbi:MAG TPA: hypothetical protein VKV27_16045 [Solirubrobacteraceae bacterium]|nr:hypothetical protein [Solirubrobacteraceae bacterium]